VCLLINLAQNRNYSIKALQTRNNHAKVYKIPLSSSIPSHSINNSPCGKQGGIIQAAYLSHHAVDVFSRTVNFSRQTNIRQKKYFFALVSKYD
jgi:hypothetical protein